jgi:hypothetical protein
MTLTTFTVPAKSLFGAASPESGSAVDRNVETFLQIGGYDYIIATRALRDVAAGATLHPFDARAVKRAAEAPFLRWPELAADDKLFVVGAGPSHPAASPERTRCPRRRQLRRSVLADDVLMFACISANRVARWHRVRLPRH